MDFCDEGFFSQMKSIHNIHPRPILKKARKKNCEHLRSRFSAKTTEGNHAHRMYKGAAATPDLNNKLVEWARVSSTFFFC